jgi:hypothetical protein
LRNNFVIPAPACSRQESGNLIKRGFNILREFKWASYDEAVNLLKWDSNKNALWELKERLLNNDLQK